MNNETQIDFLDSDLKDEVVQRLHLEELPPEEQNTFILKVTSVLLERAALDLLEKLPPGIASLLAEEAVTEPKEAFEKMKQYVPDADGVVRDSILKSLADYEYFYNQEIGNQNPATV